MRIVVYLVVGVVVVELLSTCSGDSREKEGGGGWGTELPLAHSDNSREKVGVEGGSQSLVWRSKILLSCSCLWFLNGITSR